MLPRRNDFARMLLDRQLSGLPVRHRPFVAEFGCDGGTVMNNPSLTGTPAFAAEYSKVYFDSKLLAIADEDGYVSIVDTAGELPTEMADDYGPNKPRAQWPAHRNAVFDIAWCNSDAHMLTASGDQTVCLWDTGHADQIATFRGHSGSVKAVCPAPGASAVFASGARDGALMVWDARAPAKIDALDGKPFVSPVITVHDAHAPSATQKRRRTPLLGRTRPSVSSVAFLQGSGTQLASGGVDGVVKFWDLRACEQPTDQAAPALELDRLCSAGVPPISQKQHGITSLALHPQGSALLVSLTGGHHFIYDPLRPNIGPTRWFGGHTVASFYVKAAWSPDGTHIISGSTDRCAYIWEVDAPDGASPYVLSGHQGEVTAVAWCPTDFEQIATTSDDATLKVWHIKRQQPEEQADDGAPRHPWVYPWQQQTQRAAAAAAAAAYDDVTAAPGSTTPLPAWPCSASTAAGPATGGATPWSVPHRSGGSAAMLAALRDGAPGTAGGADQQQQQTDENLHSNLRPATQEQDAQRGAPAGAADAAHQQQQQGGAAPPSTAASARPEPLQTPAAAAGTPATAVAASRTPALPTSGRPAARRIADLLNAAPSTRRPARQQSIASFLRSPALLCSPALCSPGAAGAGGSGGSNPGRKRDLPPGCAVGRQQQAGSAGRLGSPLPGLGGSALPLPSPRNAKRLRTTFDGVAGSAAAAAAAAGLAAAGAARAGPSARHAGAAAAQLEPSPEAGNAAAAAAAKLAGGMLRKRSGDENLLSNVPPA